MRRSDWIAETRVIWGHLPLLARYAVSGAVLGAVGYLMHRIGLDGTLPREMRQRPPTPQDTSWRGDPGYRSRQHGRNHHHSADRAHDERHR